MANILNLVRLWRGTPCHNDRSRNYSFGLSEGLAQISVTSGKRKQRAMGQQGEKETFSGTRILPEELNSPRNPELSGELPKQLLQSYRIK